MFDLVSSDDLILFLGSAFCVFVLFFIFYGIDQFIKSRILKKAKLQNHIYYMVEFNKKKNKVD